MIWVNHLPGLLAGTLLGAGICLLALPGEPAATAAETHSVSNEPRPPEPITNSLVRAPTSTKTTLAGSMERLEQSPRPLLRSAELTQLGYAAAGLDMNHAITQIDAIRDTPGKLAYLKGVFTRVAEDKPPYEAIQRVKRLSQELEIEGFKTLVAQWTGQESLGRPNFEDFYRQLLGNSEVSSEIKDAWLRAYQTHPARTGMVAELAASLIGRSPSEALALGDQFSGWERERFYGTLAQRWSQSDPEAAWAWISENREHLPADSIAPALELLAERDPSAAIDAFESFTAIQDRINGAAAIARYKATGESTEAAMAWADSLPTTEEQDAAHEAIYVATPRGIGAVLQSREGVLTIGGFIANSPAEQAGLRQGDRIVEVDPGDGQFHSLAGGALEDAVGLIRGEPGSGLRLRVLRSGGETAVIELSRQQLVFGND